jgi:hypothetical protein
VKGRELELTKKKRKKKGGKQLVTAGGKVD